MTKYYKGFNKDMTCRGFQYKEGETYTEAEAALCKSGFHACEDPLDCFGYYAPAGSVYHEVEMEDISPERNMEDTKVCAKTIKIGAKLDMAKICELHFEYVNSKCKLTNRKYVKGYRSSASAQGYRSSASVQGNCSSASAQGDCSSASAQGYRSSASAQGDCSSASVQGYNDGSVALALGYSCQAKADLGNAICICERGAWNGKTYPLLAIKAAIVDGVVLKPDTWYKLEKGEFVEAKD